MTVRGVYRVGKEIDSRNTERDIVLVLTLVGDDYAMRNIVFFKRTRPRAERADA